MERKICPHCQTSFITKYKDKIYCSKQCKARAREKRAYYPKSRNLKISVLTHYGNGKLECVRCGENRLPCLSIDHINNNGCIDRRTSKIYGNRFYKILKQTNFPLGYQTLCMNCQFLKADESRRGRGKDRKGATHLSPPHPD